MKKITILLFVFCFITLSAGAQNNWTQSDKDDFVNECIKSAKDGLGDSSKRYCTCMMNVMMAKYPKVQYMDTLTEKDFNTPEFVEAAKKCLIMRWPEGDRKRFVEGCIGTAKAHLGEEKAKQYCNCMLGKMEMRFVNGTEGDKLSAEDLKTAGWQNLIKGCIP